MSIFSEIQALNFPLGKYVVIGGAVLEAHNIRKSADIDILVTKEFFNELESAGWEKRGIEWREQTLHKENIDILSSITVGKNYNPDIAVVIKEAQMIQGIPFQKLEELMGFKNALGREKDKLDLLLIAQYLLER